MTANPPTGTLPAKHPRGIYTLFFTEMWERMSYYGMRALLILYMTALPVEGGMGLPDKVAAAIYGLYVCGVYLVALPGGWLADRLLSPRKAVLYGGIIIAAGHLCLAVPGNRTFFTGLLLVVMGTALLKPCASSLVGQLYPEGGARRDAGFTLFYMGVNVGGFLGPLICGWLGEKLDWHWGFAAAGVGMVAGVIQYALTQHHMGDAGVHPAHPSSTPKRHWMAVATAIALLMLVAGLALAGVLPIDPVRVAKYTSLVLGGMAVAWFAWAFAFAGLTGDEKKRLGVLAILFVASALFWSGFEQAGSSMNFLQSGSQTGRCSARRSPPAGSSPSTPSLSSFLPRCFPGCGWRWRGALVPLCGHQVRLRPAVAWAGFCGAAIRGADRSGPGEGAASLASGHLPPAHLGGACS